MQEHKNDWTCTSLFVVRHVGTARFVSLDTLVSTCSTGSTKSNVSSRVESSQVEFELMQTPWTVYRAGVKRERCGWVSEYSLTMPHPTQVSMLYQILVVSFRLFIDPFSTRT